MSTLTKWGDTTTDLKSINAIESETGIIASLIHNPDFVFYSEQLKPEQFTEKTNKEIYAAITELSMRGIKNIDAFNIKESLGAESGIRLI